MNKITHFSLLILILSLPLQAVAQGMLFHPDDTVQLQTVNVISKRNLETEGFKTTTIKPAALKNEAGNNLGNLLRKHTPVFIKQYGAGGISSVSVRGTGASHTKVLWNGIGINSPMLGQLDFSAVPVEFIDEITLHHSGNALSNSRGSLGGSLNIYNAAQWKKQQRLTLRQEIGNFSTSNSFASFVKGNKQYQIKTRLLHRKTNTRDAFETTGMASKTQQAGAMQEFYFRPGKRNVFSAKVWLQKNQSRLKRSEFQKETTEQQYIRTVTDWKHYRGKQIWSSKLGMSLDQYHYDSPAAEIHSRNRTWQLFMQENLTYRILENLKLQAGMNTELQYARTNNYRKQVQRFITSAYAGMNYRPTSRLSGYLLLKQGLTNTRLTPFIPSIGLTYQLLPGEELYLKANFSRNFKRPSLNDIYWQKGGNTNLAPEKGISGEAGISWKTGTSALQFNTEHTVFYSSIRDWILWLPGEMNFWEAKNVKHVLSRGYEASGNMQIEREDFKGSFRLGYSYTQTTNQTRLNEWDRSKNKQLIYVPYHNANAGLQASFRGYSLMLMQTYTGKRFTTRENTQSLPAYNLTDASLSKTFHWANMHLSAVLKLENLFDRNYEALQGYPMPGRKIKFSVRIKTN